MSTQRYYDLVGEPPVCTSLAFLEWQERLRLARRGMIPAAATAAHVYFANAGNDATGTGSIAAPFKTTAKAAALVAAWSSDPAGLYLHFKCGDRWNMDTDGRIAFDGKRWVVVTDYGDRVFGRPIFDRWGAAIDAGSLPKLGNSYWRDDADEGGEIYTVREQGKTNRAFRFLASTGAVDATPGSCFRDSGTAFFFRPFANATTATKYEFIKVDPTPTTPFFSANSSGWGPIFICNVNVSGCGLMHYGTEDAANAKGAIWFGGSADDAVYVFDSEATYGSRHLIVSASPSTGATAGTVQVLDGVALGWASSAGGMTLGVANAINGGTDFEAFYCTLIGGEIPRPGKRGGIGLFSHTSGAAGVFSLFDLVVGLRVLPTTANVDAPVGFGNPQPMTTLETCRAFIVDCRMAARPFSEFDAVETGANVWAGSPFLSTSPHTVVLNSELVATLLRSTAGTDEFAFPSGLEGTWINCRSVLDATRSRIRTTDVAGGTSTLSPTCAAINGASAWKGNCWHHEFEIVVGGGAHVGWLAQQFAALSPLFPNAAYKTRRSIFRAIGTSPQQEQNGTTRGTPVFMSGNVEECGYFNLSVYFGGTIYPGGDFRTLDPSPTIMTAIGLDGTGDEIPLEGQTIVTVGGVSTVLEFDARGTPRFGRNALGRIAVAVPIAAAGAGSGASTDREIQYDAGDPSAVPFGETETIAVGEGRDWLFAPVDPPEIPLDPADWSVRFSGFGLAAPLSFAAEDTANPLEVGTSDGRIRAKVAPTHTTPFLPGSWGSVDLVFDADGDDAAIVRRVSSRAVA